MGRHRVFEVVARFPSFDRDVYSRVFEQGLSPEHALLSLRAKYPHITQPQLDQSVDQIRQTLTPRQLWLLSTRRPRIESLDTDCDDNPEILQRQIPDSQPNPEAMIASLEQQVALEGALERLPKADRLLIRLRFEQELTLREVAKLLDLKDAQTADRRIREVLERLRTALAEKST